MTAAQPLTRHEVRAVVLRHAAALDATRPANPFARALWTLHFIDQVARDDWQFFAVHGSGQSLCLLYSEPAAPSALRALTNYYASQYTPFAGPAAADGCAAVVQQLSAASTVDLAPLSIADAEAAEQAFRGAGWLTRRYQCFGNWTLPADGLAFDAFMAARPSQLVNTWRRKAKKFSPGNADARLQIVTAPEDVDAAMRAYDAIYAKSWKQPEPYPAFVGDWARLCAAQGWLRLGIAWSGSTPIAAQFWFTIERRAYIFKLAYDEAFSQLSAGTVLSAHLFKHSLDVDRVVEIDYLTGDDAYKRQWMTERRARVGVVACNPRTLRGALRGACEWTGALRQRVRRAPAIVAHEPGTAEPAMVSQS